MFRIPHRISSILFATGAGLALITLLTEPAFAQSPGVNLAQLAAQVAALQATVNNQQNTITNLQKEVLSQQNTIDNQAATIATLKAKTASISVQNGVGLNTELVFTGVNVHIVDGTGFTDDGTQGELPNPSFTGLGNLVIGYNESRVIAEGANDTRSGSHNLILGDFNNYSAYGGFVSGINNSIAGANASIFSGDANQANGAFSTVTGGHSNTAGGLFASISGGFENLSNGTASSVSGGHLVTASADNSWVAGSLHSP